MSRYRNDDGRWGCGYGGGWGEGHNEMTKYASSIKPKKMYRYNPQPSPITMYAPSPPKSPLSKEAEVEGKDYVKGKEECVICMDKSPEHIFSPCAHFICCKECSDKIDTCPLCKTKITNKTKVYRA